MNVPASSSAREADNSSHRVGQGWRVLVGVPAGQRGVAYRRVPISPPFLQPGRARRPADESGGGRAPRLDARAVNYATNSLQEGDVVSITFQYSTNFNAVQKITLDGVLNLESVGAVKAAGRTVVELQTELGRLYKPQVKDDVITVKLIASANSVYISGAVLKPGQGPYGEAHDRPGGDHGGGRL